MRTQKEERIVWLIVCDRPNCKKVWACEQDNGKLNYCSDCYQKKIRCFWKNKEYPQFEKIITMRCPLHSGWMD